MVCGFCHGCPGIYTYCRSTEPPIGVSETATHSANTHRLRRRRVRGGVGGVGRSVDGQVDQATREPSRSAARISLIGEASGLRTELLQAASAAVAMCGLVQSTKPKVARRWSNSSGAGAWQRSPRGGPVDHSSPCGSSGTRPYSGAREGNPRCSRIFRATRSSLITAITRRRAPQTQAKTSSATGTSSPCAKTRFSRSAQSIHRLFFWQVAGRAVSRSDGTTKGRSGWAEASTPGETRAQSLFGTRCLDLGPPLHPSLSVPAVRTPPVTSCQGARPPAANEYSCKPSYAGSE
jgi:hypothetical protein